MFTGIIEEMGTIENIAKGAHSAVLTINARKILEDVHIGDSIAVNGVCLTVTSFDHERFTADVMHETLNRSALAQCKRKSPVNLERAMSANGRFGGHIVAGHVDATGQIAGASRMTMPYGSGWRRRRKSFGMWWRKVPLPSMALV